MVYFTERFLSGVRHLVILSDRNQPREDGLNLIVEKPWAGAFADHWPRLNNNSVLPRLSVELPLSEGKSQTHWGTVTKVPGEFCFTDCYWEWLELVVGRNTRLLYSTRLYGADLWSFGGLPIKGDFYEERIPSFKELTSTLRDKTKCLPTTCQYLFQAYYSIVCTQRNDRSASSKNDSQQKEALRSKSTRNPDGSKIQAHEWSSRESMLFAELGIKDDLKDETYLAAFLSCWLCLFVFSQKGSFLCPGVFRAASLMAAGTIYSFAVPVLANIYHGLAYYFDTHYPLPTEVRGPKMTNFSGEGGSIYFGEYEARELIHNGARIQWHANLQNRSKHERMVDTHDSSFLQTSYFDIPNDMACYLRSRWIIYYITGEYVRGVTLYPSYTCPPVRWSLASILPKNRGSNLSGKEIRLVEAMIPNLEDEVKEHKDESDSSKSDCHWKRPLKKAKVSGDHPDGRGLSALEVPDSPLNDHLEGLIEPDSDESLTGPHTVVSTFEEVGTSKTPVNKLAEQSLRPSALLEEIHRGKMTTTRNPEPSQWVGEKMVSNFFQKTALCMWEDIQDKIMRTPFEYIPRLRPEIATVLSGIEKIHADGLTSLEEYLNSYLKRVDNFNDVQSSYSPQLLSTDKTRQLNEKTSAIKEALTLVKKLRGDVKVIQERTAELSLERKELEKRLRSINDESEQLSILSCEKAEAIDQQELEVAKLQDEVNTLESTPAITEEAIEALATVCQSMEAAREEFKNFKWRL
ncbi:hypothetical protein E5676_scaffold403G00180 [Cucumis melo var. makuwa]|uniref:Aminotransferase-like plant mobile domain-containing protein n=1 Tax=Cucumis melo var. makuwa TaxID=1194695 RepID=A0A5A7TYW3_CUCMM|nr:hypothetical protein E6C27_scaffold114G00780 [Cucumis melo var. makuwa]TYK28704.1 hypothetical protein E5676_scaffold403G00180 [Cucumis melo var. makuwa]